MSQIDHFGHNDAAQRPRSAAQSQRIQSQSLGRFFQQQSSAIDEKTVSAIWKGFGSYIAKQLRNGKGVSVPKLGNFTFTPTIVDLAVRLTLITLQGTTNPGERDKQFRDPVFQVGKDFVSAVPLRTGIAHNRGAQIRPYDIKGASGIIPKVKINYTEVATLCGQNKDICRNGSEQVFRFLSDKVRKGEQVSMEIPFVGQFMVRSGIAAIAFLDELSEETKGVTAKNHFVNNLFASSVNRLNLQINDQSLVKNNPSIGLGGAMRITGDAENWLKSNLNISVQDMVLKNQGSGDQIRVQSAHPVKGMQRYGSMRPEDLKQKSWAIANNSGLTEQNKQMFDKLSETKSGPITKRPMSAATRVTSNSRMTNIPELGRMKLMIIANDIFRNRSAITEYFQGQKGSLRDMLSSSEILQIFKKLGIFVEIGHLKALLKELGFNWNGKSCSLFSLFQQCQQYLYGQTQLEDQTQNYFQTVASPKHYETAPNNGFDYNRKANTPQTQRRVEDLIQLVKDLFYSTKKSIYEIYQQARLGQNVDLGGFKKVICDYSNNSVSDQDIQLIFTSIAKGKDSISYQEFEKIFKWQLSAGSDWETRCIRVIRDWMFKSGLSSDTVFELFLKRTNKILQKRLTRADFHKVMNEQEFRFSAPEIDGLFDTLDTNQDGELDIDEWKDRIYEDSLNPLQMLREVVQKNKLTPDDILFKMQLRIWDAPLDFPKLCEGLRRLDPTLSETQIRHLAKQLKNKDNKVEVTALLRNLSGQEYETVDYRNRIFRQIYSDIHPHNEKKFIDLLQEVDPLNDGRVEPQGLKIALKKVVTSVDDESIDRFIRFLDKDRSGKVKYMEFLQRMSEVSNRDHNPFKSIVQRLAYFIESNSQTINSILRRLSQKTNSSDENAVPTEIFAGFLKNKIDKKRSTGELRKYATYMDIDKDGLISEIDLQTCLNNLNSDAFFKNGGEALVASAFTSAKKFYPTSEQISEERSFEIAKQIRTSLINQKIAYKEAFNRFDENKDGFLSFSEFTQGIDKFITLSVPVKEKIFALMDKNKIGLVDYPNFLEVIQLSSANKLTKGNFSDNFDWENDVIEKIKHWVITERITVEEAFKCFDRDFDGYIKKDDLKWGIINILKIKEEEILTTKLDRLFRLLDFYKTNQIQLSDFQRLINNQNPYSSSGQRGTPSTDNFRKSFGGSFTQTSTFDWKLSAIQQMGLILSRKYTSLKESFEQASEYLQKLTFEQFKKFIEHSQALHGFNMTLPLIQKLFAELDPHKKGYLTENDWLNAFQAFNHHDQVMIELKNSIQCNFTDFESAFEFFLTFKAQGDNSKIINAIDFEKALESLASGRFKKIEVQSMWKNLTNNGAVNGIDKYKFRSNFDNIQYTGNSSLRKVKTAPPGARTTIVSQSSSSSQWETDILEKLRQIIRSSSQSFEDIFREFDEDKNGVISQVEFRNAIRKLNLGLSSREIDKIMAKIDTNSDGKIDWKEFISKFKTSELDERLKERAKDKMAKLKELMMLHMTSPNDAFRFFDESKLGKLTYQEFSKLIIKAYDLAGEKVPSYPIIKDLFDTIDIRKDGILDLNEWQQTFGHVVEGNNKLTIRSTPLSQWENTREYGAIGNLIAKSRKLLKEQFEKITKSNIVSYDQAKIAMLSLLQQHFNQITDEKLRTILRVAELQGANSDGIGNQYDYVKLLEVYKSRHAGPQL